MGYTKECSTFTGAVNMCVNKYNLHLISEEIRIRLKGTSIVNVML